MATSNVYSFRKAQQKLSGLEGLVTIETISALISLSGHSGHVYLDYTIGLPCGCAFCVIRERHPEYFRRDSLGSWNHNGLGALPDAGLGGISLSEHLK